MQTRHTESGEAAQPMDGATLTRLVEGDGMNAIHILIEPGTEVPMHSHPNEQLGYVMRGEFTFLFEDDTEYVAGPGASYLVTGGRPHAAENRGDVPVEAIEVFAPPRSFEWWD